MKHNRLLSSQCQVDRVLRVRFQTWHMPDGGKTQNPLALSVTMLFSTEKHIIQCETGYLKYVNDV